MAKELEALKQVKNFLGYNYCSVDLPNELKLIEQALQRLEAIDNANPSEALECLENLCDEFPILKKDYKIINKTLIKAQEQEKVLEIIKKKGIDIGWLRQCNMIEEYNYHCEAKQLTQEEFKLLKRWTDGLSNDES